MASKIAYNYCINEFIFYLWRLSIQICTGLRHLWRLFFFSFNALSNGLIISEIDFLLTCV